MATILLIEDMKGVRDSLEIILTMAGHTVSQAEDGRQGLEKTSSNSYDLVITDILMPEVDGTEVILKIKEHTPNQKIMAVSAGGSGVSADQALAIAAEKADAVLEKPFSKDELLHKVEELTK